ncbi:MAG: hypothetical protein IKH12_07370 [Clostridia bacterium]|nr:hypothetical protein [Clostridia bacterium]
MLMIVIWHKQNDEAIVIPDGICDISCRIRYALRTRYALRGKKEIFIISRRVQTRHIAFAKQIYRTPQAYIARKSGAGQAGISVTHPGGKAKPGDAALKSRTNKRRHDNAR